MEGFRWILPNKLAGAAQPGLMSPLEDDVRFLVRAGIRHVVSLRRDPPVPETHRAYTQPPTGPGLHLSHFSIDDMSSPTPERAYALCGDLIRGFDTIGATLLLIINIVCLNLGSKLVLLARGVHARRWFEKEKSRRSTIIWVLVWAVILVLLLALAAFTG